MGFDVAVVGAGPAGLAAAVHACDAGLHTVLIDAGRQPGGQFWRHRDEESHTAQGAAAKEGRGIESSSEGAGHHDWKRFTGLRSRLYAHEASGRLSYLRGTQVWLLERAGDAGFAEGDGAAGGWRLRLSPTLDATPGTAATGTIGRADGSAESVGGSAAGPAGNVGVPAQLEAAHVILCPGGYDRQLPVPGWDLPGVMAAGGVQALLKGSQVVPGGTGVVAGTGPFLLPVATGLAAAGVKVAAICEANAPSGWLRHAGGAVRAPEKALEGVEYAARLARHRIPYRIRTAVTEIHGTDRVEAVTMSRLTADGSVVSGSGRRVPCDFVALGWGFTPSLELVLAVGAETCMDVDGSLVAVVDERLRSSVEGVSIAGEATGIGGAAMAVVEGELASLAVAVEKWAGTRRRIPAAGAGGGGADAVLEHRITRLQKDRARLRAFAVAMHGANPLPARWHGWLTPETVVCRCEEVSYGDLCNAHEQLGAQDARSLKSFARPGMGWCQGRVCGFATASIAADFAGRGSAEATVAADLRAMSKRTLAAPVPLGQLASLAFPDPEPDSQPDPEPIRAEKDSHHE